MFGELAASQDVIDLLRLLSIVNYTIPDSQSHEQVLLNADQVVEDVELLAEAEVHDLKHGVGVEAQVLGLDVAVAHALRTPSARAYHQALP